MNKRKRNRKGKFKLFLVILSHLIIFLFLFEFALRLFVPYFRCRINNIKLYKFSSDYRRELKPNGKYKFYLHPERMEVVFDVATNSCGFRGKDCFVQKSPNTFRIICIGDSCTFGSGVNDNQTFPFILQEILNRNLAGQAIEVINAGIEGFTSIQGLNLLKKKIVYYNPDVVIAWFGMNDSSLSRLTEENRIANVGWEKIKFYLNNFCVFHMLTIMAEGTFKYKHNVSAWQPEKKFVTYKRRVSLDDYIHNIAEMVRIAKKNNFLIVFLNTPLPGQNFKFYKPQVDEVREYMNALERMARNGEIILIDIASVFLTNNRDNLFIDWVHPDTLGHQLIAKEIARGLLIHK